MTRLRRILDRAKDIRPWLRNRLPGSTPGSKWRNLLSYTALAWSLALLAEVTSAAAGYPFFGDDILSAGLASVLAAGAFVVFWTLCIGIIFLHSEQRPVAAGRLLRDTAISALYATASFALVYRYIGVNGANVDGAVLCFAPGCSNGPLDHLYFSTVTFSTLGYGDATLQRLRMTSALQATLGNLHLGIFVGAVFYFLSQTDVRNTSSGNQPNDEQAKRSQGHDSEEHRSDPE